MNSHTAYEGYNSVRLDKAMYKAEGGLPGQLEELDPSHRYKQTELEGLDAFERQLKRFDIKVSGPGSDAVAKFFATADSAALFPEYVSRAVAQGAKEGGVLEGICAARTDINSLDYRSITSDLSDADFSGAIGEGEEIPEVSIALNDHLVRLKKRGRLLSASYEAIKFQRIDVITVALRQIGCHITKAQLADAVALLVDGDGAGQPPAEVIPAGGSALAYADLLLLWSAFGDFDMNVLLAPPDMVRQILSIEELRDPANGLHFQSTGELATPLGARLIKCGAAPAGKIIALDKRYALEMVCAGGVCVEYDKLIDAQLERAAVTAICGFSKIFPGAVKVLELQ